MVYFGREQAKIAKSCKNQDELSSYVTSLLERIESSKRVEAISEIERKLGLFTGKIRTAGFFSKRISLADAMQNALSEYKATFARHDIQNVDSKGLEALARSANDSGRNNRLDEIVATGFYNKRSEVTRNSPSFMKRAAQAVGSLAATVALGMGLSYSSPSIESIPTQVQETPVMAYTMQEQERSESQVLQSYADPIFEGEKVENLRYQTQDIPTVEDKTGTEQRDQMMDWLVEDYFEGVSDRTIIPTDKTPFYTGGGSQNRFAYAQANVDSQGTVTIDRRGDFEANSSRVSIIHNYNRPSTQQLRDTHRTVERLRAEEEARRAIRRIETLTRSRPLTPRSTLRRDPRATRVQEERIVDYSTELEAAVELDPLYHLF